MKWIQLEVVIRRDLPYRQHGDCPEKIVKKILPNSTWQASAKQPLNQLLKMMYVAIVVNHLKNLIIFLTAGNIEFDQRKRV